MTKPSWIWRETAEVLGVLGVIASLIFVAFEIRENTRATRSSTIQDVSRWSFDANAVFVENADIRAAWRAGCEGTLNQDQRDQLLWAFIGFMRIQANRFYQVQLGTIDEETAFSLGGKSAAYESPMFKQFWPSIRESYEPGFQDFVERELLPLSTDSCRRLE